MKNLTKIFAVFFIAGLLTACGSKKTVDQNTETKTANSQDTVKKEETKKEEALRKNAVSMSENLLDYTIQIDGEVYQLPFSFSELEANGWYHEGTGNNEELQPSSSNAYMIRNKETGTKTMSVTFQNTSSAVKNYKDCDIIKIEINDSQAKKTSVKLPKDITIGSKKADIVKAYGEPQEQSTMSLRYYIADKPNEVKLSLDDSDAVQMITIKSSK